MAVSLISAIWPLEERDAGERGQPVYELVLESRVTGLWCGCLALPVVPVAAAHGCGCVVADGEPCLGEISHPHVAVAAGPPILVGTQSSPGLFGGLPR